MDETGKKVVIDISDAEAEIVTKGGSSYYLWSRPGASSTPTFTVVKLDHEGSLAAALEGATLHRQYGRSPEQYHEIALPLDGQLGMLRGERMQFRAGPDNRLISDEITSVTFPKHEAEQTKAVGGH